MMILKNKMTGVKQEQIKNFKTIFELVAKYVKVARGSD